MRLIGTLSLASCAAAATLAFLGVSSGMAGTTSLCNSDPSPSGGACPAGAALELKANGIHYVDPLALFRTIGAFGITKHILCEILFIGEALDLAKAGTGGQVVHGKFSYGKPHGGGSTVSGQCFEMENEENCPIKEVSAGGLLKFLRTAHELGIVTGEGFEALVECAGLHCVYNSLGLTGHALGPLLSEFANGAVTISNQSVNKVSGTLCPSTTTLTTTTKPLTNVYFANGLVPSTSPTYLCSEDPKGGSCQAEDSIEQVHYADPLALLAAVGAFGIKKDILCEALFSGAVLGLGEPQIIHGSFSFGEPHGGEATVKGKCFEMENKENCGTVKEISSGGLLKVLRTAHELGEVTGEGFEVLVECGGLHCIYNAKGLVGHALGPLLSEFTNGAVTITSQKVNKVSGFLCPNTSELTTTQKPSEPIYLGT